MKLVISENTFVRRNQYVREALRVVLTRISRYEQGAEKDILLLSSRRSGSTWLMECLGAEPGLRSLNEPFGPKFVHRSILAGAPDFLKACSGHRLYEFTKGMAELTEKYMSDPGLSRLSGPYNPLSPSFHFCYNRSLWKVIHANPAIEYFYQRAHQFHTMLLLRHPCPTILSMQKKYEPELSLILQNKSFCQRHLDSAQFKFLMKIEDSGSTLQKFAAEWALEQIVPLKKLSPYRDRLMLISYEAILTDPGRAIQRICEYCNLSAQEEILASLKYPSASTAGHRMGELQRSSIEDLVGGWREKMSVDDESKVFEILDTLGIDSYSFGQNYVNAAYNDFKIKEGN